MKKWFIGITVILIIFVVAGAVFLYQDDELSPGAQKWLSHKWPETSKAYYFRLGFEVSPQDDPIAEGKKIFDSMKQAEEEYLKSFEQLNFSEYPKDNQIEIPEGELFCKFYDEGCLEKVFATPASKLSDLVNNNQVLLKRFKQYLQLNDYSTLTTPLIIEYIAPVKGLLAANRLSILDHIVQADTEGPEVVINNMLSEVTIIRSKMAKSDQLIHKIVTNVQIADYLQAIALLLDRYQLTLEEPIPQLTQEERSLKLSMMREYIANHHLFRQMLVKPDDDFQVPSWAMKFIFKKNISSNAAYIDFSHIASLSEQDAISFAKTYETQDFLPEKEYSIRNVVGNILLDIASPDFRSYIARFHDLDCRIKLFNELANKDADIKSSKIYSPYFEDKKIHAAKLSDDNKNICLNGPAEDDRKLRCLRLAI